MLIEEEKPEVQWTQSMMAERDVDTSDDEDDRVSLSDEEPDSDAKAAGGAAPEEAPAEIEVIDADEQSEMEQISWAIAEMFNEDPIDRINCPTAVTIKLLTESHSLM